jgi:outer membrane protein assembly factor BamB/tetratricopeptide (TPR) repeat protein
MLTIFCPQCHELILDQPACATCGWQRPRTPGDAGVPAWQSELGHRLNKPRCYPVIAAGRYCVATEDGAVVALDLATGQKAWERLLGEGRAAHSLASDGERIFAGCVDTRPIPAPGTVFLALDARTGAPAWEYPTSAHSLSAAVVEGDTVFFTSSDGLLHAVDAATGQKRWIRAHPAWGPEAPAAGAGVICAGGRGEALAAYAAADGAVLWRFAAEGWFAGELCIADGRIYTPCWDGYLYALDARSGQLLWKVKGERDKGFTSALAVAGERVFAGSRVYRAGDGQPASAYAMLALRVADGGELWRFYTGRHIFAPPTFAGDTLLFGADDGCFYALDAVSGAERWRAQIDERIVTQPRMDGDLVYVGERDGTVYAFRWRTSPTEQLLPPEVYLKRREYEQAAVAHALSGQFEAAATLYEQLDRTREAALLYERAGQPGKAAPLWQKLGEHRRARDRYSDAGDQPGLASVLAQLGEPLQAAHLYQEIGSYEAAARLYEQSGDRVRAAELYDQVGQYSHARTIWESLGRWERQVEDLIHESRPAEAAAILERHEQFERAAELYEEAGQLRRALDIRVRLEHWERVVALASRVGDYEQEAAAHEQLSHPLLAAEAYERVAQQAAEAQENAERVAALYERAALSYSDIGEEERAVACQREVRRYRKLPEVVVMGEAHEAFVEYEWNALTLRVENSGYGPARDVTIALRGEFDVEGNLQILSLPPKRSVALEISMRPHREQYGPKVPLEIVVLYTDARGGRYQVVRRHPVHVVRRGAEPGIVTPLEIRVGARQLSERSAQASQEEIDQQRELLTTYRRTLAHYLNQRAALGAAHVPPEVSHGLREARDNIRRIKGILRVWGVPVEDKPDDEPFDGLEPDA